MKKCEQCFGKKVVTIFHWLMVPCPRCQNALAQFAIKAMQELARGP